MASHKNLADDLLPSILESKAATTSAEILEFSIDQIADDGILKNIPIVNWAVAGFSVYNSISDRLLFNKLLRFMSGLESSSLEDTETFRLTLDHDPKASKRISEQLLLHLDKLEDQSKPTALGKCFSHYLSGDISNDEYLDLASAICTVSAADLELLRSGTHKVTFSRSGRFVSCGLAEFGITNLEDDEPELSFRVSKLGMILSLILQDSYRQWLSDRAAEVKIFSGS